MVPELMSSKENHMSILESHPSAAPITISHELSLTGVKAEALWEAYRTNFEPLAELAILQHYYARDEVLSELANPRITKIVGWQLDTPVGLAMVTNSLEDVPQISPAFLRSRYPAHAARNAIYVGILVMVAPGVRGRTLFGRLSTELWQVPAQAGGVLVFDICDFNREMFDAEKLAQRIADNFPRSAVQVVDHQTWYAAELPEAIPGYPTVPSVPTLPSVATVPTVPTVLTVPIVRTVRACSNVPTAVPAGSTASPRRRRQGT
jgi:hypothetical protein